MTATEYTEQMRAKITATEIIVKAIAAARKILLAAGLDDSEASDQITEIFELDEE